LLFELYLEQKLSGFGGVVSILGDPPAKLKTIDYYPVINTFNMIDNYSFIPVAVCGVGSYRGPSPLLFSGPSMLLRRPCICPTSFAPFVA
jgi:hypothetical protein